MKATILVTTLALAGLASNLSAQDGPPPGERPPRHELGAGPGASGEQPGAGPGPGAPFRRPGVEGRRPPVPPLFAALDGNHDGVIDEQEIATASESLKKLDKNGDGKITAEELRPPRPEGAGFPPGDQGGFRGPPVGRPEGAGQGPPGPGPRPPRDESF